MPINGVPKDYRLVAKFSELPPGHPVMVRLFAAGFGQGDGK